MAHHLNTNKQFMIGNGILAFAVIFVVVIFVYMSMRLQQRKEGERYFAETYNITLVKGFTGDSISVLLNDSVLIDQRINKEPFTFEVKRFAVSYDLIQHFQTIINYPLPGSSFAGRSNLCRYNIAFSVLRLLLETASRKQLPIEIMRTYFRVSTLQHKGFFLPISRLPLIPSFISPFGIFCHSLLPLTPSRLDR